MKQQGFTLIELMIVVAIIGILAAVAVPQYRDYTIRSQVTEGLAMAGEFKAAVSDRYATRGVLADASSEVGLSPAGSYAGNYVSQIAMVASGGVNITYGNRVNQAISGGVLSIRAATNGAGNLVWLCGRAPRPTGPAKSANSTDIANKFLPGDCRP